MTKNSVRFLMCLLLALAVPCEARAVRLRTAKKPKAAAKVKKPVLDQPPVELKAESSQYFHPAHTLPGIGLGREDMDDDLLAERVRTKIDMGTFVVLCDPKAISGAQIITSPEMQDILTRATTKYDFPKDYLEGLMLIESYGDETADSGKGKPTGAKGIMQIVRATAIRLGLKVAKIVKKHPTGKDERFDKEKAVFAAAKDLARMRRNYGRVDFAVWGYHSGEGFPNKALALSRKYGISNPTFAKLVFGNSPVWHKELYELIKKDMSKDLGATYYFNVQRAVELLALYRQNPAQYETYVELFKNPVNDHERNSLLWFWYPPKDIKYFDLEDLKAAYGKELVVPPNDPEYFSFSLRTSGPGAIGEKDPANRKFYIQAPPEVVGLTEYVAYEVRRLWETGHPKKERFVPLPVTTLIRDLVYQYQKLAKTNVNAVTPVPTHTMAAVDISYLQLPSFEKECLDFVLQDLAWAGLLGHYRESKKQQTEHISPSPAQREFFTQIEQEARQLLAQK